MCTVGPINYDPPVIVTAIQGCDVPVITDFSWKVKSIAEPVTVT